MNKIGFIQGRLSEIVDNKIQAFPWLNWREEYKLANQLGFNLMEWTLDNERLYENPIMTDAGKQEIHSLGLEYDITIDSVTGDCFMQAPFWKMDGISYKNAVKDMSNVIESMGELNIQYLVVPLVDNGSLEKDEEIKTLIKGMESLDKVMSDTNVVIVFESDFPPDKLVSFIDGLDDKLFGINYDIGNSAALGYEPEEEINAYGSRVYNVHVKDRLLAGTTVPLGEGNAKLSTVFNLFNNINYQGNYILQTARANNGEHGRVLASYRDMVQQLISHP